MTAKVIYTEKMLQDYFRFGVFGKYVASALRYGLWYLVVFVVLGIVLAVSGFFMGKDLLIWSAISAALVGILPFGVFCISYFWYPKWPVKKMLRRVRGKTLECQVEPNTVSFSVNGKTVRYVYGALFAVYETEQYFYFCKTAKNAYIVPKRCFLESEDEAVAFLRENIPVSVYRKVGR